MIVSDDLIQNVQVIAPSDGMIPSIITNPWMPDTSKSRLNEEVISEQVTEEEKKETSFSSGNKRSTTKKVSKYNPYF